MSQPLTFDALEQRIRAASPDTPIFSKSKAARVFLVIGAIGAVVALYGDDLVPGPWKLWVSVAGLLAEVVGFLVYFVFELRQEIPWVRHARLNWAKDVEREYSEYLDVLAWLRSFPGPEVRERLQYLRHRQSMMARRFGLVVGGIDRLGVLPVAVAVYFQIRDMGWPPQVGLWQGTLVLFLIWMYVLSHWLAGLKLRLDLYVSLLCAAVDRGKPPAFTERGHHG